MLLGAIGPALTFLGVSAYWERAIQGAIILAAVADRRGRADRQRRIARGAAAAAGLIACRGAGALVPNGEWVLLAGAGRARSRSSRDRAELLHASATSFEITRLSVELGLLAVALTPVIVTGGIDLSVGSMMGLRRSCSAPRYRDWQVCRCRSPRWSALLVGCAGGALNALLIARLEHSAAHRHARDALAVPRHRRRA